MRAGTENPLEPEDPLGVTECGAEGSFFDLDFIWEGKKQIMYPVIPAELMQNAVQLVVYFVTIARHRFGLMFGRA